MRKSLSPVCPSSIVIQPKLGFLWTTPFGANALRSMFLTAQSQHPPATMGGFKKKNETLAGDQPEPSGVPDSTGTTTDAGHQDNRCFHSGGQCR